MNPALPKYYYEYYRLIILIDELVGAEKQCKCKGRAG
jgi:hypothetical protein